MTPRPGTAGDRPADRLSDTAARSMRPARTMAPQLPSRPGTRRASSCSENRATQSSAADLSTRIETAACHASAVDQRFLRLAGGAGALTSSWTVPTTGKVGALKDRNKTSGGSNKRQGRPMAELDRNEIFNRLRSLPSQLLFAVFNATIALVIVARSSCAPRYIAYRPFRRKRCRDDDRGRAIES